MSLQSLKKIGQKLLKLQESGNEALMDGWTDTQTVRRGIIINLIYFFVAGYNNKKNISVGEVFIC